jgi:hypothetical protein
MNAKQACNFLTTCIGECEADGYQQIDNVNDVRNPHSDQIVTPDEWFHDGGRTLWLKFGPDTFKVKVSKKRTFTLPPKG